MDLVKLEEYYDLFAKEIKEKEKKYKANLDEFLIIRYKTIA